MTRSKPDWAPRFLEELRRLGTIRHACESVGCSRTNVYQRRDGDKAFAAALADAHEDFTDLLDAEGFRRAVVGVDDPILHQGVVVATVKKYSDSILIMMLKARRYQDVTRHEHSGAVIHTVEIHHDGPAGEDEGVPGGDA